MPEKSWNADDAAPNEDEGKSIVDRERSIQQRRQVERELAAQRQRLRHGATNGKNSPPDTGGLGEPVEEELARLEGTSTEQVVERAKKDAREGTFDVLKRDERANRRNGSKHA